MTRAERHFKTVPETFQFRFSWAPAVEFTATTEAASFLFEAFKALDLSDVRRWVTCEPTNPEFLGWTVEDIAEHLPE